MSDRNMAETLMANGGQRFAVGGISNIPRMAAGGVPTYTFDPITGKYTQIDGVTAASTDVPKYTYDPVTQKYTLVTDNNPINNPSAKDDSGGGGDATQPLSKQTIDFLDNEAKTPGARDARMQGISNLLSLAVPGGMAAKALSGAFPEFAADMSARMSGYNPADRSYGGASMAEQNAMQAALSSPNTGVGIPGESAAIGEGIGGGDISGQSESPSSDSIGSPAIANGGLLALAQGGISNLGDYSDGGRLLRGPGDGVSDSIPATIANKQPARLADGEFVVPARIVSELGNGSTEAGARKLYQMLARVQNARKKTIGQGRVAVNSRADKMLPA
jgi:hypothetical protein